VALLVEDLCGPDADATVADDHTSHATRYATGD
jgi:hypothetical protein